jgi:uncharacterized membrane protein
MPQDETEPKNSSLKRNISIFFIAVIIVAIVFTIFLETTPNPNRKYSEFYLLGSEGKAENYPRQIPIGQRTSVIAGIVNHEQSKISYKIDIFIDNLINQSYDSIDIPSEYKWEQQLFFLPTIIGNNQKLSFVLYKEKGNSPYLSLYYWINVLENE